MAATKRRGGAGVADHTDEFDRALEFARRSANAPAHIVDAAVYVRDTVDLAWKAATSIFGKQATPDVALAIFDRINAERRDLASSEPV